MILIHYYGDLNDSLYLNVARGVFDLKRSFKDLLLIPVSSVTKEETPLVYIEGTLETTHTNLLEIGNQFCSIANVSIRFGHGAMIFHAKGKRFDRTDLDFVENKMREIVQNFVYPDPNSA